MYIQSSVAFVVLGLAAKAVVAVNPPACLLAAINSQPNASDVAGLCGSGASKVQEAILKDCGNNVESAYEFFRDTCKSNGHALSSSSSSSSSARSSTASASSTSTTSVSVSTTATGAHGTGAVGGHSNIKTTVGVAAPTGVVPGPGTNGTVSTGGVSSSTPPAPTSTAFTGGAARSLAGSFAGVAVVAAGFVIAL